MKLKFGHKVFLTFLLNSLLIIVSMLVVFRFHAFRNFGEYIGKVDEQRLKDVSEALAREYRKNGNLTTVAEEMDHWGRMLGLGPLGPPSRDRKGRPDRPPPFPSEPLPEEGHAGPGLWSQDEGGPGSDHGMPPPPPFGGLGAPPPPPGAPGMARGPGGPPRIVLFDAEKRPLTNRGVLPETSYRMRSVEVDDVVVGWVGMPRHERLTNPIDVEFMRAQMQTLYTVGGLAFLLAVLVTFVFSRNILAPIKELAKGTRALTSRRFETRIEVRSADEFGRLASDFNEMARALERFEEMRRQWMADISHELRTPLAILRGEIEAMQDGIREMTPEALESLHAEIEHLSRIVNALHDLSLIESRWGGNDWKPVVLDTVLKTTLRSFTPRLERKGLKAEVEATTGAPVEIMAEPFRLTQLFSNLLENALRYATAPGTVKIRQVVSNDRVLVIVEDSGPGVPEESLGRLFDRLYRVDKARSRANGGSGLGLAICKSIVESFGGRIAASNGTWGGLRITMDFPVPARRA